MAESAKHSADEKTETKKTASEKEDPMAVLKKWIRREMQLMASGVTEQEREERNP